MTSCKPFPWRTSFPTIVPPVSPLSSWTRAADMRPGRLLFSPSIPDRTPSSHKKETASPLFPSSFQRKRRSPRPPSPLEDDKWIFPPFFSPSLVQRNRTILFFPFFVTPCRKVLDDFYPWNEPPCYLIAEERNTLFLPFSSLDSTKILFLFSSSPLPPRGALKSFPFPVFFFFHPIIHPASSLHTTGKTWLFFFSLPFLVSFLFSFHYLSLLFFFFFPFFPPVSKGKLHSHFFIGENRPLCSDYGLSWDPLLTAFLRAKRGIPFPPFLFFYSRRIRV